MDDWTKPPLEPRKPWWQTALRVAAFAVAMFLALVLLSVIVGPWFAP